MRRGSMLCMFLTRRTRETSEETSIGMAERVADCNEEVDAANLWRRSHSMRNTCDGCNSERFAVQAALCDWPAVKQPCVLRLLARCV
jgi:hypothetical protein